MRVDVSGRPSRSFYDCLMRLVAEITFVQAASRAEYRSASCGHVLRLAERVQ